MKRIFIISLIFLLIALFFLGVYNFAFKKEQTLNNPNVDPKNQENFSNNSTLKIEKIYPVTDFGVIGATYDKKTDSLLYYSAQDGTTWKSDADGKNKQQTSDFKISGLKNVSWSPDKNRVLTMIGNNEKNVFYEYDNVSKKATKLKDGMDNVIWDNMGNKIFYKYFDNQTKQRTLNIANYDGSNWEKLIDINFRNISISQIPLTSLVSFWNFPAANEESILQTVGAIGDQPKIIFKGRYGADYLWSPNGSMALVSSLDEKNGKKITMGVIDINGNYTDLNVPTLVSKCVWSSDNKTVYYALANNISDSAIMPDDYQNEKINTRDTFWKMDITTGKKDRIIEPEDISDSLDAINMFLSPTEDSLYFMNRSNKQLYKIEF